MNVNGKNRLIQEIERVFTDANIPRDEHLEAMLDGIGAAFEDNALNEINDDIDNFFQNCEYDLKYGNTAHNIKVIEERISFIKTKFNSFRKKAKSNREILIEKIEQSMKTEEGSYDISMHLYSHFLKSSNGLKPGYYIITGDSNVGKSAFMIGLNYDIAVSNNGDVHTVYYTLDDSVSDIIDRFVAHISARNNLGSAVEIANVCTTCRNPNIETNRHKSFESLDNLLDKSLEIVGKEKIQTMSDLIADVKDRCKKHEKVVVFIDAIYKIQVVGNYTENQTHDYIADALDDMAIENEIPIITVMGIRKEDKKGHPTKESIKGSNRYHYNAKHITVLFPKDEEIFLENKDRSIFSKIVKNKLSKYRGTAPYEIYGEFSYVRPVTDEYEIFVR